MPVTITSSGWTLSAYLLALLNVIGIGGALAAFIRTRPQTSKIKADREANLLAERAKEMESMRVRISSLEQAQRDRDAEHAAALKKLAEENQIKEKLYEAQKAYTRHCQKNTRASFKALLMLLKRGVPAQDAVAEVEAMEAEHAKQEASEAATIRAAAIKAGIIREDEVFP